MSEPGIHLVCTKCGKLSPGVADINKVEGKALEQGWLKRRPEPELDKRWHCQECLRIKHENNI